MVFAKGNVPHNASHRVVVHCANCESSFTVKQYTAETRNRHFCNRDCFRAFARTRTGPLNPNFGTARGKTLICKTCQMSFYRYPSELIKPGRTNEFCSTKCMGPRMSEVHKGKTFTAETRAKLSASKTGVKYPSRVKPVLFRVCSGCEATFALPRKSGRRVLTTRRFCTIDCWYEHVRQHPGESGNYRGTWGKLYGPNWQGQSKLARARDNYTCQDCGAYSKRPHLDVHHLVPRRLFGVDYEHGNALENLITVCKKCHATRERALTKLWQEQENTGRILLYTAKGAEFVYLV